MVKTSSRLLVALVVQFGLAAASAESLDANQAASRVQACNEHAKDPRLDSVRAVFPVDYTITMEMLSVQSYPTRAQVEALRLWRANVQNCAREALGRGNPLTPERQRYFASQDLQLGLLMAGKLTFGGFALFKQVEAERATQWLAQVAAARQDAKNEPRPLTGLACTFDTGGVKGLEMFVQFDEAQQKVWPNRGGEVSSSWVNQSSIGYVQGKSTFVISRVTGSINWSGDGVGMMGTGLCVKATAQKF